MTVTGKQFLVTGGAGFIGSHLVDRLLAQRPAGVVVVDNFDEFYNPQIKRANIADHVDNQSYLLVKADIRDYEALKQIFAEHHFDAIIHLAAKAGVRPSVSEPRAYTEVNINGTMNLLELAERNGVGKFVFGSSSSVYGPAALPPFKEDAPLAPISPYASTKASGELLAHAYSHLYGMRVVCLRFFTVYGPRQRPDLAIHKFARMIASRSPIQVYGDGSAERDFTYIEDILQGVLAAIEYGATPFEVINLGESQTVTVNRMIEMLEEALGQKAVIERCPPQPGDLPLTHADITKAQKLLAYQPTTPIETGIKKFAEWFKRG
ncbi:MAG TPA: GDP-mannose 4,6-dehydratase [Blastocatellia bacterium]|jgi:UDP-glucuronate 4-epimerase|nr:GDP-mannose 4,6-dehydratase [Blastocatellia bacterium]